MNVTASSAGFSCSAVSTTNTRDAASGGGVVARVAVAQVVQVEARSAVAPEIVERDERARVQGARGERRGDLVGGREGARGEEGGG